MKIDLIVKKLADEQINGLGPLEASIYKNTLKKMLGDERITLVNIICPGYRKERERGVEEFDFIGLSVDVAECPNVSLMIEKMNRLNRLIKKLGFEKNVLVKLVLADVAILNYGVLNEKQNVNKVMDEFFQSIKKYTGDSVQLDLLKMSELPYEFKNIPLSGVDPQTADTLYNKTVDVVRIKADEYMGSLVFERANQFMSEGTCSKTQIKEIVDKSEREVKRFLAEYGLAGSGIRKMYKNPIILFTEPSGYMRGYFYNAFLKGDEKLPVMYLC